MTSSGSRVVPHLVLSLARLLGGISLLAFAGFLLRGPSGLIDLGLDDGGVLALGAGLSLVFFVQHSAMIRRPFRTWLARRLPERYGGAVFAIASAVVLLAFVALWQESSRVLWTAPDAVRWVLHALAVASLAGMAWSVLALGTFDLFGHAPIREHLRGEKTPASPFSVRGPYRWIRHPLYFFTLVMLWAYPGLTLDRLLFNGLWTGWIVVGTALEERDLLAEFGEAYREYQRRVPMLLPWRVMPATRLNDDPGPSAQPARRQG
jgi:protein-S-isoprenylcysteine O-methyltransferase Ste14